MDENTVKLIAQQLRRPEGDIGIQVGQQMNTGNKWMNVQTIDHLNILPGDNILEIGMGNGIFVDSILKSDKTIHYSGCDYSGIMVEEAGRINNVYVENGQAKFHLANAEKLPFEDDLFDKVFAVNVFYFWENPSIELAEIKRVLKPGGSLTVTVRPKHIMANIPYTNYGFNMYTKDELIKVFNENNYKVAEVLELDEPDMELEGKIIKLQMLIISAFK
jgi:ubiquinone/menaquinone biosynthesis C-methylase UbiE